MLGDAYKDVLLALAVPGLYCLLVLGGRRLKRQHGVRLGWLYHLLALSLAVYVPAQILQLAWHPFLEWLLSAILVLGSLFLIALVDRYVWEVYFRKRHHIDVPKFLTEVVRLAILIVAAFFALWVIYGATIKELLFTPAILAVVVGLAMQDLLGNIIAGMAIQVGKPFVQGDWLLVHDRYAQVIEINWRGTRLVTNDDISIEIPHREMAGKTIINLNRPTKLHAMRLSIGLDYSAAPTRVKHVLQHATANAQGIAPEPKPKVYLKNFGESSIEYEIKFWLPDQALYYEVCDAIRTNVWYGLHRHGIKIPFPIRTVQLERPGRSKEQEVQTAARHILRQQPLFKALTDVQLDALLPRGQVAHFGSGEKLIEQGEAGDSMFILVNGEASVLVTRNGHQTHVAALKSGDCFGEMSLLTGERRSATVQANRDCEVVEIGKSVLAASLKEHPELLATLSELLARRQVATEGLLAAHSQPGSALDAKQTEYQANFLDKLRTFFEM